MMNKNGGITKLHIKFTQRVLRIQMVMESVTFLELSAS